MGNIKNYGLNGLSASVELGKKGIKLVAGASELLVTDSDGLMLIPISAGRPLTSDHVVTKGFLDEYTTPDYVVYGEMLIDIGNTITFGADITPIDGKIYIVTHNEGTLLYNVGELYRFNIELGTYEAVIVSDGAKIVSANTLNTGDITFKNATLYIWEESESLWYEGVRPNMTGVHYTKDFMLTFMNGFDTQIPTGISIPANAKIKEIVVNVDAIFTDTLSASLDSILTMGTMGDPISILDGTESDLDNIGYYVSSGNYSVIDLNDTELYVTLSKTSFETANTGSIIIYVEYIMV